MSDPEQLAKRSSSSKESPQKETRSLRYVVVSAFVAATLLALTVFLFIRGYQWRGALAELRAEPGIEILSVERVGFFKKRLRGLRDPLAPSAEEILREHHIGRHAYDLALSEYHSLNTPYAEERKENSIAELQEVRNSLIAAVGEFAARINEKRETDLEKITQMLFETRFPEEMESVDIEWRDGTWFVQGELYAPQRENFVEAAPDCIVEGAIDFSGLDDLTLTRTSSLREAIESTNLLEVDLDGNWVHLERIARLLEDYDLVCDRSELPPPRWQLSVAAKNPETGSEIGNRLSEKLRSHYGTGAERWLSTKVSSDEDSAIPSARFELVPSL
ncbi:MAG: hypothetical protein AAGC68_01580 [Verrucomicrobiota bacterium]